MLYILGVLGHLFDLFLESVDPAQGPAVVIGLEKRLPLFINLKRSCALERLRTDCQFQEFDALFHNGFLAEEDGLDNVELVQDIVDFLEEFDFFAYLPKWLLAPFLDIFLGSQSFLELVVEDDLTAGLKSSQYRAPFPLPSV